MSPASKAQPKFRTSQEKNLKLRIMLILFALLTLILVSFGGYFYYSTLRESALEKAQQQSRTTVQNMGRNLDSYLTQFQQPVQAMAGLEELQAALQEPSKHDLEQANQILDHFADSFEVSVCYLMNRQGKTIASSNRNDPDSFVDQNYGFRPYFKHALSDRPDIHLALGITSGERGAYYSHPVRAQETGEVLGVAVMKASIEFIESQILDVDEGIFYVQDPHGIIFISNKQEWLLMSTRELSNLEALDIRTSKQFGSGPWPKIDWDLEQEEVQDDQAHEYLRYSRSLSNFPQWELNFLRSRQSVLSSVQQPFLQILAPLALILGLFIGLYVFYLYTRAEQELSWRRAAEDELRKSERNYRYLYHNTPAMLHSIDTEYRLLQVSDFWLEATGYTRKDVLGRKLTDFLTRDSKQYAEQTVLPYFFQHGFCNDVPYKLIKKDGSEMDILLTCTALRDEQHRILRTLAVSVDVTERKKEQEELQRTKELLQLYSRELENLVSQRTQEISGILKYTPALVYLKNTDGTYRLVNDRFREILALSQSEISAKKDRDLLPQACADQFSQHDQHVLQTSQAAQFTEWLDLQDGRHTYLSVKFPIYNQEGQVNGLCGICTDITELQRTQNRLQQLSRNIIANQEKEREAISRELHDELGQMLTALRMDCVWLVSRLEESDTKAWQRSSTMLGLIDRTLDDVSKMSKQLRPGILDDLGLVDAVESMVADYEKRTDISWIYSAEKIPELAKTEATAAYRIIQEALTNCVRHSQATEVLISLEHDARHLLFSIQDNGVGFVQSGNGSGFGIAGMRERAYIVGGEISMSSSPNLGTTVYCKIPLHQTGAGRETIVQDPS
ncbi:MAG: PAS domain-containing protein [Desulfohalobiaceae bacterium]